MDCQHDWHKDGQPNEFVTIEIAQQDGLEDAAQGAGGHYLAPDSLAKRTRASSSFLRTFSTSRGSVSPGRVFFQSANADCHCFTASLVRFVLKYRSAK